MYLNKEVSLNLNVRGLGQSATIAINEKSKALQAAGKVVYRLGLGQSPFPVPEPVVKALRHNAHQKDYLPAAGLQELRQAVARYHQKIDNIEFNPNNIIIGPGSKELMFILQLVYYGELIVPTPCWVSYVPQAKIIGKTVSLIHTKPEDKWRLTPELFDRHCHDQKDDFRPRILVLNYPGNPEGCSYNSDELADLAEVARKYKVILLSDEIYGQLHHEGAHTSVAKHYPEGTIISSGLSKWCGAGGWRLGTFAFPESLNWLMDKMTSIASETYTSVCAPIQYAAVRAFGNGMELENYLWHARRILKLLGKQCADKLNHAGVQTPDPVGAFYLFINFEQHRESLKKKNILDSPTLCERLLEETGVAMLPGEAFSRSPEELTARIAYVDFNGAKALSESEAIAKDQPLPDDFTSKHCANVIEAVERICEWVK